MKGCEYDGLRLTARLNKLQRLSLASFSGQSNICKYPSCVPHSAPFYRRLFCETYLQRNEKPMRNLLEKHSSLFRHIINDEEKKCCNGYPCTQYHKNTMIVNDMYYNCSLGAKLMTLGA
jgi:hypothetical protein